MKVVAKNGRYEFKLTYNDRHIAKDAGFLWDQDQRVWWTRSPFVLKEVERYWDECVASSMKTRDTIRAASSTSISNFYPPCPEGKRYYDYQRAGIEFILQHPNCLLADDMGLGKTSQAVGVLNCCPDIKTVLVLCPATLRLNWKSELEAWLTREMSVSTDMSFKADIDIVSYDSAWRSQYLKKLENKPYDCVILDEVHSCKSGAAKRTYAAMSLAGQAKRKIALTGTPLPNRPIESYTVLHLLDPDGYPDYFQYAKRYCAAHQEEIWVREHVGGGRTKAVKRLVWNMNGASNLDELNDRLRTTFMVRRMKVDVLTDLPTKTRQVIEVGTGVDLACVRREKEEYEAQVMSMSDGALLEFTTMAKDRQEVALLKIQYLVQHVTSLLTSTPKVVIMAYHRDVVASICDSLKGFGVVRLVGGMSEKDKQISVDTFQNDPETRVFVGNIKAAGTGITLTAANVMVFVELVFSPGDMCQAEDRILRIGQKDNVLIQHLVLAESIDVTIAKMLLGKQHVIDTVLEK